MSAADKGGYLKPAERRLGWLALALYAFTIPAANWTIQHIGTPPPFPGGPHTIPVGFGLRAPSGVLWIGLAFTLRDLVQRTLGRWWTVAAIAVGAALSWAIAPSFAVASAVAFGLSELADFAVYTPLERRSWLGAVALSNTVGAVIDSALFLWLAFHSLDFIQGQVVGKLWMTALAVALLAPWRLRRRQQAVMA